MRCIALALALVAAGCKPTTTADPSTTSTTTPTTTTTTPTSADGGPPATRTDDVVDTYHGVAVADPYRWLEDGDAPEVREWSDAQNRHARAVLDAMPAAAVLRPQVEAILAAPVVSYQALHPAGGKLFASKRQPPKPQPLVVLLDDPDDPASERVLLDPAALDPDGSTSVDWFRPSPDGRYLAVSLSVGGSETGDVHVYEVATGQEVFETIARVNGGTAGGDLAWGKDGKGFFYTRYPRDGERPPQDMAFYQQLYYHRLGTPVADDRYELGQGLPRVAEIQLDVDPASGRVLATVQKGDGGEFAHHLRQPDGTWTQLSDFGDRVVHLSFGPRDRLYVVSRADAPRGKLLQTSARKPDLARAKLLVPQGEDTLVTDFWGGGTVLATADRVYVLYQRGGPSEVRAFDRQGKPVSAPAVGEVAAVHAMVPLPKGELLLSTTSYVDPVTWLRWSPRAGTSTRTALSSPSAADFSGVEVHRELARSPDGTAVPVNILAPAGLPLDGSHPCLVTGYGGFGVSLTPYQRATWSVLLRHGFVVAVANLRGGSEFGDAWHEAGRLVHKQNVFDDFDAVLRHLVDRGYTRPERLAIEGGSNGGLLMGAALVQHPERVRAVVSHVGIYDMLRVELSANGAFNVVEYGTVKDPAQFAALRAYSPYHNVEDGTAYPAVLMMTGANDPRVDPMQSRKMTARLQAATSGDAPVLLRTSANTGHGGGTPLHARVEQTVDAYAFLFEALGVEAQPVPGK
ncbi:MAG: S9 family peptidase [Myxococcales bacterium]|nr:S9 family peptidase [Myxococcales bacterium]